MAYGDYGWYGAGTFGPFYGSGAQQSGAPGMPQPQPYGVPLWSQGGQSNLWGYAGGDSSIPGFGPVGPVGGESESDQGMPSFTSEQAAPSLSSIQGFGKAGQMAGGLLGMATNTTGLGFAAGALGRGADVYSGNQFLGEIAPPSIYPNAPQLSYWNMLNPFFNPAGDTAGMATFQGDDPSTFDTQFAGIPADATFQAGTDIGDTEFGDPGFTGQSDPADASIGVTVGGNSGGDSGGCYITTATLESTGEADDGETLSALREFRDNVLAKTPEGQELIAQYELEAPLIVEALDQLPNRKGVYKALHDEYIAPAVAAAKSGAKEEALSRYAEMVTGLSSILGSVKPKEPGWEYGTILPARRQITTDPQGLGVDLGAPVEGLELAMPDILRSPLLNMSRGGAMASGQAPLDPNAVTSAALDVGLLGSMAPVPPGAAAMFGGIRGRGANLEALARARGAQEDALISPRQVWQQHSWDLGFPREMPRMEFPGRNMLVDLGGLRGRESKSMLPDVLQHPELFKAYPQLRDVNVQRMSGSEMGEGLGVWQPYDKTIGLNENLVFGPPNQQKDLLQSLMHETQHAVQDIEGFPRGASVDEFLPQKFTMYNKLTNYILQKAFADVRTLLAKHGMDDAASMGQLRKFIENPDLQKSPLIEKLINSSEIKNLINAQKDRQQVIDLSAMAMKDYTRTAGEVEARVAAQRAFAPDEWKRLVEPSESVGAEVPMQEQLVLGAGSGPRLTQKQRKPK